MDSFPQILFVDGKLYKLDTVPQSPNCYAFKVFDAVLQKNIYLVLYRGGDAWELMIMDDQICVDVQFDKYFYDKDTNCFYPINFKNKLEVE